MNKVIIQCPDSVPVSLELGTDFVFANGDRVTYSKAVNDYFKDWTCAFPGKMGISWKRAWDGVGTKIQAEAQAAKNCNVIAIPLVFFEKYKEYERRMVEAESSKESILDVNS